MFDDDDEGRLPSFPWVMIIPAIHWILVGMVCLAFFLMAVFLVFVLGILGAGPINPWPCLLPMLFLVVSVVFIKAGLGLFHGDPRMIGIAGVVSSILGCSLASWGAHQMLDGRFGIDAFLFSEGVMLIGSAIIAFVFRTTWDDWARNRIFDSDVAPLLHPPDYPELKPPE